MKFTCNQTTLNDSLGLVSRAVSSRPVQPVLGHVLVKASNNVLTLTGFDLAIGIQIEMAATVDKPGAVTVPAKLLGDIVSRLNGDLTVELKEDDAGFPTRAIVTSESGRFEIGGGDAQEFPLLPTVNSDGITLPASVILEGLRGTVFCASTDDTKQVLTGVHIKSVDGGLEFAATDGHRLAVVTVECEAPALEVTLPSRALRDLERLAADATEITFLADDAQAVFVLPDRRLTCRKLDGAYPAYPQLIPKQFARLVTVDRRRLISGLERVAVLADQKNNLVILDVEGDRLSLEVSGADVGNGRDLMSCELTGDQFRIAFNINYLLNGLKVLPTQSVTLQCNEPNQPAIAVPVGGSKMLYLVMPVQIANR